jgi:hypothetical protein
MDTMPVAVRELNGATFQAPGDTLPICEEEWGLVTKNLRSRFGGCECQGRGTKATAKLLGKCGLHQAKSKVWGRVEELPANQRDRTMVHGQPKNQDTPRQDWL